MEPSTWAEARPGGLFGGVFRGWVLPAAVIAFTPPLAILFWLVATRYDASVLAFARDVDVPGLVAMWPEPSLWAVGLLFGWTVVQGLLLVLVPGREHLGPPTPPASSRATA
jgi:hypothetical protein